MYTLSLEHCEERKSRTNGEWDRRPLVDVVPEKLPQRDACQVRQLAEGFHSFSSGTLKDFSDTGHPSRSCR
jgi:hypothetical protein